MGAEKDVGVAPDLSQAWTKLSGTFALRPVATRSSNLRIVSWDSLEKQRAGSLTMFTNRLRKFRGHLFSKVVTGKLDVRAAASNPLDICELDLIDDVVEGDDLDESVDATENEEVAA